MSIAGWFGVLLFVLNMITLIISVSSENESVTTIYSIVGLGCGVILMFLDSMESNKHE